MYICACEYTEMYTCTFTIKRTNKGIHTCICYKSSSKCSSQSYAFTWWRNERSGLHGHTRAYNAAHRLLGIEGKQDLSTNRIFQTPQFRVPLPSQRRCSPILSPTQAMPTSMAWSVGLGTARGLAPASWRWLQPRFQGALIPLKIPKAWGLSLRGRFKV